LGSVSALCRSFGIHDFQRIPEIKKGIIPVRQQAIGQEKALPCLPQEDGLVRDGEGLAVPLLRLREKNLNKTMSLHD
jgi:hypothetical protein